VIEVQHGAFAQVTALNPGFRPGIGRLKLTLDIPETNGRRAAGFVEALAGFLPTLSFHRCCGRNSVKETFFEREKRLGCAMEESDPGVDLAHLVEHVLIDVQHFIGRMKICSAVTCAYRHPRDRYDIFVECPEEAVGRLSAGIAADLVSDLLDGRRPDPRYLCLIHVARSARDHAGWPVHSRLASLEAAWGRRTVAEAVGSLVRRGFLTDSPVSFNFSSRPLLAYIPPPAADRP